VPQLWLFTSRHEYLKVPADVQSALATGTRLAGGKLQEEQLNVVQFGMPRVETAIANALGTKRERECSATRASEWRCLICSFSDFASCNVV
jgi:hypothetical protein